LSKTVPNRPLRFVVWRGCELEVQQGGTGGFSFGSLSSSLLLLFTPRESVLCCVCCRDGTTGRPRWGERVDHHRTPPPAAPPAAAADTATRSAAAPGAQGKGVRWREETPRSRRRLQHRHRWHHHHRDAAGQDSRGQRARPWD